MISRMLQETLLLMFNTFASTSSTCKDSNNHAAISFFENLGPLQKDEIDKMPSFAQLSNALTSSTYANSSSIPSIYSENFPFDSSQHLLSAYISNSFDTPSRLTQSKNSIEETNLKSPFELFSTFSYNNNPLNNNEINTSQVLPFFQTFETQLNNSIPTIPKNVKLDEMRAFFNAPEFECLQNSEPSRNLDSPIAQTNSEFSRNFKSGVKFGDEENFENELKIDGLDMNLNSDFGNSAVGLSNLDLINLTFAHGSQTIVSWQHQQNLPDFLPENSHEHVVKNFSKDNFVGSLNFQAHTNTSLFNGDSSRSLNAFQDSNALNNFQIRQEDLTSNVLSDMYGERVTKKQRLRENNDVSVAFMPFLNEKFKIEVNDFSSSQSIDSLSSNKILNFELGRKKSSEAFSTNQAFDFNLSVNQKNSKNCKGISSKVATLRQLISPNNFKGDMASVLGNATKYLKKAHDLIKYKILFEEGKCFNQKRKFVQKHAKHDISNRNQNQNQESKLEFCIVPLYLAYKSLSDKLS